jgi:hypothetical protein
MAEASRKDADVLQDRELQVGIDSGCHVEIASFCFASGPLLLRFLSEMNSS